MVLNYYSDRLVGIVFFLAVIVLIGMYFFPDGTLNIVGLAVAGIKPAIELLTAIIAALVDVFTTAWQGV